MPTPRRTILGVPPGDAAYVATEAAPAVPIESQRPGSDSVPPGAAEMAELIQGLGAHLDQLKPVITRLSSSLPPPPRVPALAPQEPGAQPAELDKGAQQLLTEAIAQAIAQQLGKVRISSVPPSSAPRSSIRAAGHVVGKAGKWSVLVSGALSLIGTAITIWRPEYAAPLTQALKLIAAIAAAWSGGAPAPEAAPARDTPALVAPAPDATPP